MLEGLLDAACGGDASAVGPAAARRVLLNGTSSAQRGRVIDAAWLQFSAFPVRWHYDVLRALDYFRAAGAAPDPRMDEAIAVVRSRRRPDGTWLLEHARRRALRAGSGDRQPSRWNTLRALRVLDWCDRPAA
ncbi:MAG: hypothetical protein R2712_08670 [Vicinamibacterales bacterium]